MLFFINESHSHFHVYIYVCVYKETRSLTIIIVIIITKNNNETKQKWFILLYKNDITTSLHKHIKNRLIRRKPMKFILFSILISMIIMNNMK